MIVDTEQLLDFVHYHRPFHLAVMDCDPDSCDMKEAGLKNVFQLMRCRIHERRYSRAILGTEDSTNRYDRIIQMIQSSFSDLLDERRIYYTIFRQEDQGIDRMYRALGAACAVQLQSDGSWVHSQLP